MKVRISGLVAIIFFLLPVCMNAQKPGGDVYRWVIFETIPKGAHGVVTGRPSWNAPLRIKTAAADTIVVYGNNDSILMCAPSRQMFRRVQINGVKWKPKPDYGKKLFFLGTYTATDLGGLIFSYYSTPDRSTILQIHYTNPGNMIGVSLFSKNGVNILEGIVIDPREEMAEPERVIVQ